MTIAVDPPHAVVSARQHGNLSVHVALALVAFAGTAALLFHDVRFTETRSQQVNASWLVLAAIASLPLIWWRRSPLGVFVLTAAASAPLLRYQPIPPVGATVALFLLAATRDARHPWTRRTTVAVAVLFAAHVAAAGLATGESFALPLIFSTLGWAVAWFAGDHTRLRHERVAVLEERATRAEAAAERERQLAAVEERMRIARDLHDSAGHAINVILVQAGAARLLQDRDAAATRTAIETIEEVARQTLGEIDQIVGGLREHATADGGIESPNGLAALDTLVGRHRAGGLDVSIDVVGPPAIGRGGPMPTTVDQAAYRILQEGLTNAARHGTGTVHVTVASTKTHLVVTVTNPVRVAAADTSNRGHGLIGIGERAALLGGEVDIRNADATFVLEARLPLERTTR